ncbi:SLAIN motif-containing protein-like [Esox lucius]|uniref:SLAIN motif-containing protein-like n=1 Tax=Esox lucius TaxID=8010 RepID=A0A3P8ZMR1_ESOLU|nr:SLAIN motif-containing protein-like [Esox lucius]
MWSNCDIRSVKSEEHCRIGERLRPDTGIEEEITAQDLAEVRKLQELVWGLGIQNDALSERWRNVNTNNQSLSCVPIDCPSLLEKHKHFWDLLDPELTKINGDSESPSPHDSPIDIIVEQDGHNYGSYTHLPHDDILEETKRQGCMGSVTLLDRDTEKRADQSALDLVDLLNLEEYCVVDNDVSWLYETPKKQASAEQNESPIKWCRQVLDNPSPETEMACRELINILDHKTRWRSIFRRHSHRLPVAFPDNGSLCISSPPLYHRSTYRSQQTNKPNFSDDSDACLRSPMDKNERSPSVRPQDLTDVRIMAQMQEESLRQDYASIPATSTPFRSPAASMSPSNYSYSHLECGLGRLDTDAKTRCPSQLPHFRQSRFGQSPRSMGQPGYSSQQPMPSCQAATQSKLLKLATSRGASTIRLGSVGRSSSVSAKSLSSSKTATGAVRQSLRKSFQATSIRGLARAQSLSPSGLRIPYPSKDYSVEGYVTSHGRVYASSERSTISARSRLGQFANSRR